MITTKIYEDETRNLVAVVYEDGQCSNYVPCPEMAALDGEGFLAEAQLGFPDAVLYEFDSAIGKTLEEAAKQAEEEGTLIALVGEKILLYPRRMSQESQEFFQMELGDTAWEELLEAAAGSEGVEVEL